MGQLQRWQDHCNYAHWMFIDDGWRTLNRWKAIILNLLDRWLCQSYLIYLLMFHMQFAGLCWYGITRRWFQTWTDPFLGINMSKRPKSSYIIHSFHLHVLEILMCYSSLWFHVHIPMSLIISGRLFILIINQMIPLQHPHWCQRWLWLRDYKEHCVDNLPPRLTAAVNLHALMGCKGAQGPWPNPRKIMFITGMWQFCSDQGTPQQQCDPWP